MSERDQTIVDRIKSWEYVSSDFDVSFDWMDEYGCLYIHVTMPADTSFAFNLMVDWTNDYFSQPDGIAIDSNHNTVKLYSFNSDAENYYQPRPEFHLSHVYFHLDLSSTANRYVCEIMTDKDAIYIKEYPLDSMKVSRIVSSKKGVHI
jgi:hypothetical protein